MVSTTETLLLLLFAIRSSVGNLTVDSIDLNSNETVNYYNYTQLKLEDRDCEKKCIRKCCQSGYYYNHEGYSAEGQLAGRCEDDATNFSVPIYNKDKKIRDLYDGFSIGTINCVNQELVETNLERKDSINYFYIQQNGSRYYPYLNTRNNNNTDYCVNAKHGVTTYYYCKDLVDENALFRRAASILPIPFQLATGLVYAILPKKNIHRKSLILHVLCLAFCCILTAVDQFDVMDNILLCKTLGYLMMYSWYATILWMNVMCIDIWLTFSGLQGFRSGLGKENVLFIILNIYAWGVAGLCMIVTGLFDVSNISPVVYNQGCFRIVLPSYWFYFATITIFTILNTTLYILTTINIRGTKKNVAVLKRTDSGKHGGEGGDKITVYWNLFCVMSTLSTVYYLRLIHITLRRYGWYQSTSFDIFVQLMFSTYAIIIFMVFVWKRKIWRDLKGRCRQFIGKSKENESSTSTILSSRTPSVVIVPDVRLTSFKNNNK